MKANSITRKSLYSALFLAGSLITAEAGTISANLSLKGDVEKATYVISSDANNLICSAFPDGRQAETIKLDTIVAINWREPDDWTQAWTLFVQHRFDEAAVALGAVYENYKGLRTYEDSYSARAKFYECESLRLSGKYTELMKAYDTVIDVKLSKPFLAQVKLFNCWGHVGKEMWSPLERIMESYEVETIPEYTVPPTGMPFKQVSPREIIQIAYLRGIAKHNLLGKKRDKLKALITKNDERDLPTIAILRGEISETETIALHDYGRVLTVSFGDEKLITKNAMVNFMNLITTVEGYKENYIMQKEAHAMAILYRDLFGGGEVPSEFKDLLTEPVAPEE